MKNEIDFHFHLAGLQPPLVFADVDLEVSLDALGRVFGRLEAEDLALVAARPSADGWWVQPADPAELARLRRAARSAWVVQRPGCAGLVTRVVLLDRAEAPLASLFANRAHGRPEPPAWRYLLLLALLA